jgi:hypothetical protein
MGWTLIVVLAVDVVVLAGFWLLVRRWLARRLSAPRQAADLGEEVGRLVTELNQAAERTVVLLEDRAAALNDLLAAADKKIGLLAREIERHEAGTRVYGRLAGLRTRAVAAAPEDAEVARRRAPKAPSRTGGTDAGEPATGDTPGGQGASADAAELRPERAVTDSAAPDPRTAMRDEIGRLARSGLTPSAIAARVGAPRGEVELILSLERRARGS